MLDIQGKFSTYGIRSITLFGDKDISKEIETEYTFLLNEKNISKPRTLLMNDINAMTHIKHKIIYNSEHWILLTWDK